MEAVESVDNEKPHCPHFPQHYYDDDDVTLSSAPSKDK